MGNPIEVVGTAGKGTQRAHTALLIYALTAGVGWWALHLTALASVAPAVCNGWPAWTLSAINALCLAGVLSSVVAAAKARTPRTELDRATDRSSFVGYVTIAFNSAATVAVVLESIPVYVLGACQ